MTEPEDPILPKDDEAVEPAEGLEPVEGVDGVEGLEAVHTIEADDTIEAVETIEADESIEADEADGHLDAPPEVPAAQSVTGAPRPAPGKAARPDLIERREPLYRECKGYRLRLDPPDLARLRELAGSRGKSDDELGEAFFDGQAERLASAIADDVPTPSEIRVVVDPYSRQAFLALENRIRGILSF